MIGDDDLPKKQIQHALGQDLSRLSVSDLNERISLLKAEIARLEQAKTLKEASRTTADQFFKK